MSVADRTGSATPYDALAHDLRLLRVEAGNPSYAELARRIGERRVADGMDAAAGRVARSTVFDAFQGGRHRINAELVRDIARVLGADDDEADRWRQRCLAAERTKLAVSEAPVPQSAERADYADAISRAATLRIALIIAIMAGCILLNLFGGAVIIRLDSTLFLDMAGTATAAFALGPWYGVIVGLATNALGAVISTPETVAFGLVNMVGALVWGYGMRRFGRSFWRFMALTLATAVACTLVAAPLNILLYQGTSVHASFAYLGAFHMAGGLVGAVFSVSFLSQLLDKLIAGGIALVLARWIAPLELVRNSPWQSVPSTNPRS